MLRLNNKVMSSLALAAIIAFSLSAVPSFAAITITSAEFVIGMSQYFVNNKSPASAWTPLHISTAPAGAPWFPSGIWRMPWVDDKIKLRAHEILEIGFQPFDAFTLHVPKSARPMCF